jgi:signal transduction histidine kinase
VLAKKTGPNPDRITKLSVVIREEATRLSAILTDFLEFAKPRSPHRRVMDVREVVGRVRNNLGQQIKSRGIHWVEEEVNGAEPLIMGDPDLLYQAFLNMAMNAFDAMEDGGILTIRVAVHDSHVQVDFADNGHGIGEEDLPRIFTPFFTTHELGTGLGLSVVHNIVTAHGGEVSVQSSAGGGTVFTVLLPSEMDQD